MPAGSDAVIETPSEATRKRYPSFGMDLSEDSDKKMDLEVAPLPSLTATWLPVTELLFLKDNRQFV